MGLHASLSGQDLRKPDVDAFFQKLESGQAVTVVTIGGSITMHPTGWAKRVVELMREDYPQAQVNFVNAGISGTGSNFGVFRLERDVMAYHPDLVFIEYAVNDGGAGDEACLRNLESIVVRLQGMPSPPAIVFVESASEVGANHVRHNRMASHYNLLDVNMQAAANKALEESGEPWSSLFKDNVHPNEVGHALYARTLWQAMLANMSLPAGEPSATAKPALLSKGGLILDGTLVVPNFQLEGWNYNIERSDVWWTKYFQGSLQGGSSAQVLHLPFYGRTVGLAMLTKQGSGLLRVAVDGVMIKELRAGNPDWYYSIYVHPELFKEGWHVLSLIPVSQDDEPAKVHIGYLLLEEQVTAPAIPADFWSGRWTESRQKTQGMENWEWAIVPVDAWKVIGPFGGEGKDPWLNPRHDLDRDYGITPGALSADASYPGNQGNPVSWQPAKGEHGTVNLGAMFGVEDSGVAYATTHIVADQAGEYELRLAVDYFVYVYVNGTLVEEITDGHGSSNTGVSLPLNLRKGSNEICLKVHAGSMGFSFRMEYLKGDALSVEAN